MPKSMANNRGHGLCQLTGRRFLDGYADDEAQYAALMNSGATFAGSYNLVPGVSLSAAQMAQLTSDIVWLVEKDITLPPSAGSGQAGQIVKALVPQLYVHVREGDLQSGDALIAGSARRDLNVTSITRTQTNAQGGFTQIDSFHVGNTSTLQAHFILEHAAPSLTG